MKTILMGLLTVMVLIAASMWTQEVEAGPVRRAIQWKRSHTPVRAYFANHRPARKVLRFVGRRAAVVARTTRVMARGCQCGPTCCGH